MIDIIIEVSEALPKVPANSSPIYNSSKNAYQRNTTPGPQLLL